MRVGKKILFLLVIFFGLSSEASEPLVKVSSLTFITDLRYNTDQNFLKKNVYKNFGLDACYVHPDLYKALQKLVKLLTEKKLKLVFWDCWRPLTVQQAMWKLLPDSRYVANPKSGSNHNRGIAIDVTLAKEDGTYLEMPTAFDDFSAKASPHYACPPTEKQKCENRNLLIELLTEVRLKPIDTEWWHFQIPSGGKYPIIADFLKGK